MSKTRSFDIVYGNIPFEGTYDYQPAEEGTEISPPWSASVWLCTVHVQGTSHNIIDLMDEKIIMHIEDILLERNQE